MESMKVSGPDNDDCRAWGMFLATSATADGVEWGLSPVVISRLGLNEYWTIYRVEEDVTSEVHALADAVADLTNPSPPSQIALADSFAVVVEGQGAVLREDDPAILDPAHLADLVTMRMLFATTAVPGVYITAAVAKDSDEVRVHLCDTPPPGWFDTAPLIPALERLNAAAHAWRPGVN